MPEVVDRFAVVDLPVVLRGDFAADVRVVFAFPFEEVEPADLVPFPRAAVFDRADVVLRDEDDRELPLLEALLRPELLRDEPPPPPRLDDDELLLPPRALVDELFRVEELLPELLRDDEPPVLFFAVELRPPLLVLFFAEPELERLLDDLPDALEPPFFDELLLEPPDELFFEPPDDLELEEPELFLVLLPPLLEPDEREPDDFLVVAILLIPSNVFGMFLHSRQLANLVPESILYQVKTSTCTGG